MARYLSRYAEVDALHAAEQVKDSYQRALVVPCFDESPTFLEELLPPEAADLLIVIVANVPDNADVEARERTAALLSHLQPGHGGIGVLDAAKRIHTLTVDRVSQPVPKNQAVGLARKIGADCATALWHRGHVACRWIYNTDADVRLPCGYFDTTLPERGAAIFPFRHRGSDPRTQHKADLYELHMRYYVNRLGWAGSRYAFHTLGSTLAVDAEDYATVRGFPRRSGGEDFHLLNKLAKVAPVHSLRGPELIIQARESQRAPFGTGRALARIKTDRDYLSYAPASFQLLAKVLAALEHASKSGKLTLPVDAEPILQTLGLQTHFAKAVDQYKTQSNLDKALHDWFDGLRTLRFIHQCRSRHPDEPLTHSLVELFPELAGDSAASALAFLRQ